MNVVPFRDCPYCKVFGLHLMPRTRSKGDYKMGAIARSFLVPLEVAWYDDREPTKPQHIVRTEYETGWVEYRQHWVVRQCFSCGKEWEEEWRTETIGEANLG